MFQLRPYQSQMIEDARNFMGIGKRTMCMVAPTGSGKTALTAHMLGTVSKKGMNAWFVVHRQELVSQSIRAFATAGFNYGVCAAGYMESKKIPVQICSIQTLRHRFKRYPAPNLIAWDEAHHLGAKTWGKIYAEFPKAYHIGLTATPWRMDGTGLKPWFEEIVLGPSVTELIEQGYLCDYKLYAPPSIDTAGLRLHMGDYIAKELQNRVDKPSITGDSIREYKKLCDGKRALVFCVSIEHSLHVAAQFNAAGIPAEHVDGNTDRAVRKDALARLESGKLKVITSVEIFGEGVDLPAIEAVILLRPTHSLGLYLQQVGRVLRPYPGKPYAIILDHAGNCQRHGLPDHERIWSLEGRESQEREIVIKNRTCPVCFFANRPGATVCKDCGSAFQAEPREIQEKEGDLQEVDAKAIRSQRQEEYRACKTEEDFLALGKKRGYPGARGWAYIQMKLKLQYKQMRQAKKLEGVK